MSTTRSTACTAVRGRRTTSRSGSAPTSRGCCASPPTSPTRGSRRWGTPIRTSSPTMNALMDERAEANGRGPQAIRRMYNVFGRFGTGSGFLQGSARDWAEQLAGLAIDEGISTFILGTDDADVDPPVRPRGGPGRARPGRRGARAAGRVARAPPCEADASRERTRADHGHPDPRRPSRLDRRAALGRVDPAALPGAGRRGVHRGAAGLPAAPRRHPRRAARRAHPAARRRRPGTPRPAPGRAGPLGDQHDDHAPEQLDARRLLRVLLPHRHRAPHARGPQHVQLPAPPRPRRRPGGRPAGRGARGDRRGARAGRPRAGRAGRRRAARRRATRLEELSSAVDLLTDTLLSHLSYEERELLHPLATYGMG